MTPLKTRILAFILCVLATQATADKKTEVNHFVTLFKAAIQQNNVAEVINMNAWSGLAKPQQAAIEKSFHDIAKKGIIDIKIEYIDNGKAIIFNKKDKVFSPNLLPVAKILVDVNTNKSFGGGYSYYIGQHSTGLKFSHIVLKSP